MIEHSSLSNNYEVFIIDGGISENHKSQILTMKTKNVSIEFVDIKPFLQDIDLSIFSLRLHFTISSYYRFFLPKIFGNYDKLIYLDCDMLVLRDVKELFDIDIGDNYLGVARDMGILPRIATDNLDEHNYCVVTLGLENCENYFNSGCMICNVKKMREDDLTKKLIEKLCEIKKPRFVDQCILNAVCHNQVKYISNNWNFETCLLSIKDCVSNLPNPYNNHYINGKSDYSIIHYDGTGKPWINPALQKSDIWWKYARMTPFYEEILYKNLLDQAIIPIKMLYNYRKNRLKYLCYKVLSKITFGKMQEKYKEKRKVFKAMVRQTQEFLKSL